MSLNKENDEGQPSTLAIPRETQEELIYVILMSLNNIATEINNLSQCAEDILEGLSKEVDRLSFRVTFLEERVTQVTNDVTYQAQSVGLSLRIKESMTFQSTTVGTQQVCSSKPLPVNMCEMRDAGVPTLPMNRSPSCQDDTGGLKVSPDASYCSELYKDKTVPESEEEKGAKPKKKMHRDRPSKPEGVPASQLMEDDVSVNRVPAACREGSRSCVDQPGERSSPPNFPLREVNRLVTRAGGKVLSSSLSLPMHGAGEAKTCPTYVRYGMGKREELQPQPQDHRKTEVFVSPTAPDTAPDTAPALPTDWLALLKASKTETPCASIDLPAQLPPPGLRTPAATSPAAGLPRVPEAAVPFDPPKGDFPPAACEPFPCCELTPDDLLAQGEDQGMPPPLPSSPGTSTGIPTRATVTHLTGPMSLVQSPTPPISKLSISSIPSSPSSLLPPLPSYRIPPPRYPVILPRSSIPHNLIPLAAISSWPQTSRSLSLSSRNPFSSCTMSPDATLSGFLGAQSLRPSAAQSTKRLIPLQQNSSSLKSAKSSTLESLCSLEQSPSCTLSSWGPSVTPSSPAPVNAALKQPLPALPVIAKVRNALMAAIRKGVQLYNSED